MLLLIRLFFFRFQACTHPSRHQDHHIKHVAKTHFFCNDCEIQFQNLDQIDDHWMNFHKKTSLKSTKGQIIYDRNSGFFKSPKNQTKFFEGYLHYFASEMGEIKKIKAHYNTNFCYGPFTNYVYMKRLASKVLFTDRCRWQNFRPKGQLISKYPYEKSVSSKIPTKIFLP